MRVNKPRTFTSKSTSVTTSEESTGYDQSDTGEDSSDFTTSQETTMSEEVTENTSEGRTHSSDTSYGVESLPEVDDYAKWRKNYAKEDEKWLRAVKHYNDVFPTHRRTTEPAKLVRRIVVVPKQRVSWAKAAREVFKRQDAEWVVEKDEEDEEDTLSSLSIHTFSSDTWDESSIESRSEV